MAQSCERIPCPKIAPKEKGPSFFRGAVWSAVAGHRSVVWRGLPRVVGDTSRGLFGSPYRTEQAPPCHRAVPRHRTPDCIPRSRGRFGAGWHFVAIRRLRFFGRLFIASGSCGAAPSWGFKSFPCKTRHHSRRGLGRRAGCAVCSDWSPLFPPPFPRPRRPSSPSRSNKWNEARPGPIPANSERLT